MRYVARAVRRWVLHAFFTDSGEKGAPFYTAHFSVHTVPIEMLDSGHRAPLTWTPSQNRLFALCVIKAEFWGKMFSIINTDLLNLFWHTLFLITLCYELVSPFVFYFIVIFKWSSCTHGFGSCDLLQLFVLKKKKKKKKFTTKHLYCSSTAIFTFF